MIYNNVHMSQLFTSNETMQITAEFFYKENILFNKLFTLFITKIKKQCTINKIWNSWVKK